MRTAGWTSVISAVILFTACDQSGNRSLPSEPERAGHIAGEATSITPGTCTTKSALTDLINRVFGAGSPNARSALGKLDNLDKHVKKGNYADARAQAYNLVDFVLKKYQQGGLPGTPEQAARLASLVFCYAGLAFDVEDPASAHVVPAANPELVLTSGDDQGAVKLPPNTLTETTLLQVIRFDPADVPGGALQTRLDQYAGYFHVKKNSDTDAPLAQPVVVAVCPVAGIPPEVRSRLRLGHQASRGFEITPPAPADFLTCPTETTSTGFTGFVRRLAQLFVPRDLHAASLVGTGVGGLASEFSTFGTVDTELSLGGGVGGLPSEFLRAEGSAASSCESGIEAPIGTPVPEGCRPSVTIRTYLGTLLRDVPVQFTVQGGGGTVARESGGTCGADGSAAATTTDVNGTARACWTLGMTPGANTVKAVPSVGGDAPPGVTFTPSAYLFTATANPPVALRFVEQPAEGAEISYNALIPVTVGVVDRNGVIVQGSSAEVALSLTPFNFAGGTRRVTAVRGLAVFSNIQLTQPFSGYRFLAEASVPAGAVSVVGNAFRMLPP